MRNCSSFNDPFTFKCIFKSQLEYAAIIWSSNYILIGISNHIEEVKTNFFALLVLNEILRALLILIMIS